MCKAAIRCPTGGDESQRFSSACNALTTLGWTFQDPCTEKSEAALEDSAGCRVGVKTAFSSGCADRCAERPQPFRSPSGETGYRNQGVCVLEGNRPSAQRAAR